MGMGEMRWQERYGKGKIGAGVEDYPTQQSLIFIPWYLYLSVVFHDKCQSYKCEKYSREIC